MKNKLELRMYGLVPYNISPIQQGIQFGHAVVEYGLHNYTDDSYQEWAGNDKTFIILNGGTTNSKGNIVTGEPHGTLNQHLLTLQRNHIKVATFYEPDLGDQLTAIVFLVDERVFDRQSYTDFDGILLPDPSRQLTDIEYAQKRYSKWLENIGGEKNEFLREFLSQFRLA